MKVKEHIVTLTVNAISNATNKNFLENVYAIEIVDGMIADAIAQCLEQRIDNPELKEHFNAKIEVYKNIRSSLR
jgi:hypothetical protein